MAGRDRRWAVRLPGRLLRAGRWPEPHGALARVVAIFKFWPLEGVWSRDSSVL